MSHNICPACGHAGRELLPKEKTQAANQLWRFLGTSAYEVRKGDPATWLLGIQAFPMGPRALWGREAASDCQCLEANPQLSPGPQRINQADLAHWPFPQPEPTAHFSYTVRSLRKPDILKVLPFTEKHIYN